MLLFVVHPESTGFKVDNTFSLQVVAVIPARFASSRFPGKPLADLDGRPMIEHVYRRVAAAPLVSRVIVATDDIRVADAVGRFGGEVRLTRQDHPSGTDRLASDGTASFGVAASMTIPGGQTLGTYTGSYSVTVAYN